MTTTKQKFEAEAAKVLADRADHLRRAFEQSLKSLQAPLELNAPTSPEGSGSSVLEGLKSILDAGDGGGRQREVLKALLQAASNCYPRTAVFIVKGTTLVGWAGRGFTDADGAPASLLSGLALPGRGEHLLSTALASRTVQFAGSEGPGFVVTEALGGLPSSRACALPLMVSGRVVAVLYGDTAGSSKSPDETAFEVIGRIGAMTLASRAGVPRRGRASSGAMTVATATILPAASHTRDADAASSLPASPEDAEMHALLSDIEPPRPGAGAAEGTPEERRVAADARRFASLLVSELLLYNEESVILGRKNRDLARRLAREIERSRQAYAARVPAHLKTASHYFDEEMVRVLAEGDAALLRR